MTNRYANSNTQLERVKKIIPLASQTYSKSYINFPKDQAPVFIERGDRSRVWDIDGNEYVDCISGLLSILIGYNHKKINNAIIKQLSSGVNFSLPTLLESEVAEKIISHVPSAEMVRFGKNGSDVTTGAIRLARAYTGRDHVAVCGYHGWHDWYMGTSDACLGIPDVTKKLTHVFKYNDVESLEKIFSEYPNQIAAIILEPMNRYYPKDNFLQKVKELAHQQGAVLIFDEIITGFRFGLGGAQELFGVTPDLTTLGKGLGNGMPISVLTGRRDIMQLIDKIHFSFTFGGEVLSLAAANKVIDYCETHDVASKLRESGKKINSTFNELVNKYNLKDKVTLSGHPSWQFVEFLNFDNCSNSLLYDAWRREMINNNVLTYATFNMMFSHDDRDLDVISNAIDQSLSRIAQVDKGSIEALDTEVHSYSVR